MDKRRLHHFYTRLRRVKPWYVLILALISGLVCLLALRSNNEHMLGLRNQLYSADQKGVGVETALVNLRDYVTSHMNTNLISGGGSIYPPIQLKYSYDRAVAQQYLSYAQGNGGLYTAAQNYCQQVDPTDFSGRNRVPCIEQYVMGHSGATLNQLSPALYRFDFISPSWSPDLAGWSLVATIGLLLTAVCLWVGQKLVRRAVK